MDQLLRIENKLLHSHSDMQRFIKLKRWACASCSFLRVLCEQNHTAVLKRIKTVHYLNDYFHQAEVHQNGALPQRLFSPSWKRSLLLPLSTTLFNAFNASWCFVWIVFNAMHLPTNHKTIKTEKERNLETHYAFLSTVDLLFAVDLLERTSSPLWTPLPPLWVFAFTGKTQITSHALWFVGGVILFSMRLFINLWFSLICLCSMFVRFFFLVFSITL